MSKLTDDLLKKVTGGQGSGAKEVYEDAVWNTIISVLSPILSEVVMLEGYYDAVSCIKLVLQARGKGYYAASAVSEACEKLKSAPQFQANELALEYLQAIDDFVNER